MFEYKYEEGRFAVLHFLIDFENVGNQGLQGASWLTSEDSITIFFSQAKAKVEQRRLQQIIRSKCDFQICRLDKTGKNALDFYIATRVGEIYGSGYMGNAAIISNDKGFEAVQDYWKKRAAHHHTVILRPNIEKAIVASNENSTRFDQIRQDLQEVNIEEEYAHLQEHMRIQKELEELFCDTEYKMVIPRIQNILEGKSERKGIYLDYLKCFGRKDGIAIYNQVKGMIG